MNGRGYERAIEGLGDFTHSIQEFMETPDLFKLVMFTGGEDVGPELYGHTSPNHLCGYRKQRDAEEKEVFDLALSFSIPMVGICRGSQFLNVMSGGTMIHHLDGHGGNHMMRTNDNSLIEVTSTHHQMSKPSADGYVLAWSEDKQSHSYYGDKDALEDYQGPEVEAHYYPGTKVFAVQYHPEYMQKHSEGYIWFRDGVLDLMTLNKAAFKAKYVLEEGNKVSA